MKLRRIGNFNLWHCHVSISNRFKYRCPSVICQRTKNYLNTILYRSFNDSHEKAFDQWKHPSEKKIEEKMFQLLKNESSNTVNLGDLMRALEKTGIRRTDKRLKEFVGHIETLQNEEEFSQSDSNRIEKTSLEHINVDFTHFTRLIEENSILISDCLRNKFVIPDFQNFCQHIEAIYHKCKSNSNGKVATYIPQLAKFSNDKWAVSICTVDGQRYSIGDVHEFFTLQSCSKPFTYCACMNELGEDVVHKYIGHEPSGGKFNKIILDNTSKPHNPMLNSGAIMSCALFLKLICPDMKIAEKFDFLLNYMKNIAGGEYVGFNNAVFLSERETADRNFAMAYYMKENRCFPSNINLMEVMDLYFQSCSMEVNTETLSVMGATLANGGICPTTGEKVLKADPVRDTLSLMYSCGMYNYSGKFAFKVGLPAKSGVSGGLVVVVPNVMSIGLWSPPLDEISNSVRGQQFCRELTELFNFHRFDNLRYSERKLDPRKSAHEERAITIFKIILAASTGDISVLQRHYMQGLDMNASDYDGRTALHVTATEGYLECVKFLVEKCGTPIDTTDRWGNTALQEAERCNRVSVVKYLNQIKNRAK